MTRWMSSLREWARSLKRDVVALWVAARDPRTPLGAKIVAACVAAYALSPVDLIPDFVPVLGYLDDLLIVPLGITLAIRLIPPGLMSEFRILAEEISARPSSRAGLLAIILIWALAAGLAGWWAWKAFESV
nr:YkvA family protein [Pseudorhizobium flavum]